MDAFANLSFASPIGFVALTIGFALMLYILSHPHRGKQRGKGTLPAKPGRGPRVPDPAAQLRAVMLAEYRPKPVLSFTELKVLLAAEAAVQEVCQGWRVMGQVSLGEVLRCDDIDGFNAINAKRVDLLVMDERMNPLAAIEYQGSGHHLDGTAVARDAVKKEAFRKAGIGFIEITHQDGPDDVRRAIWRLAGEQKGGEGALPPELSALSERSAPPLRGNYG